MKTGAFHFTLMFLRCWQLLISVFCWIWLSSVYCVGFGSLLAKMCNADSTCSIRSMSDCVGTFTWSKSFKQNYCLKQSMFCRTFSFVLLNVENMANQIESYCIVLHFASYCIVLHLLALRFGNFNFHFVFDMLFRL